MRRLLFRLRDLKFWGHKVAAGPWPMYRLIATAMLLGSISQLYFGPPQSLKSADPSWFDPIWLSMMMIASILIIVAIGVMGDTAKSAYIESAGLVMLFGAMLLYSGSYVINIGIPQSFLTFIPWAIIVFCPIRFLEIRSSLRATFAELDSRHGDGS